MNSRLIRENGIMEMSEKLIAEHNGVKVRGVSESARRRIAVGLDDLTRSALKPQDCWSAIRIMLTWKIPEKHVRVGRLIYCEESTVAWKCFEIGMIDVRHFLNFFHIFAGFQELCYIQNTIVLVIQELATDITDMRIEAWIRIDE